jgi:hypothetical protein
MFCVPCRGHLHHQPKPHLTSGFAFLVVIAMCSRCRRAQLQSPVPGIPRDEKPERSPTSEPKKRSGPGIDRAPPP